MFSAIFAKRNNFGHAYVASRPTLDLHLREQLLSFNALN